MQILLFKLVTRRHIAHLTAALWLTIAHYSNAVTADVLVQNADQFRQAVTQAKPGTCILLSSGNYTGGFFFSDLKGEDNKPIIIAAADPANPPVIQGAATGLHLSRPAFVELHNLVISNATDNGLNIDDAGSFDTPAHHLVLRGLKVSDVGPGGNRDCIKLSGVSDFRVENCRIERWGTGGGSGIDMVGCHRGVIESNLFRHTDTVGSTGVQAKGGTSQIAVRRNRFENAGGRAVNIGGSTGLQFFRPRLKTGEACSEARDIRVEGNTFIGGGAAVAFVGVDGASVRFNTIYHPKRWALRILQENRAPDFVPSRLGEFSDNLVAFDSHDWAEGGVNIGSGTAPETFTFARNWWYCLDDPARSRPKLPVQETEGVYGKDPLFHDAAQGNLRLQPNSPASQVGADALPANSPNTDSKSSTGRWRLLFSGSQDISDTWGKLHFGVTPIRLIREQNQPGFTFSGGFPLPDGSWEVFGQQLTETKPGNELWQRTVNWKLLRCRTRDGSAFEDHEVVLEQTAPWTDHAAIARNGDTGEYLVLKLKVDNSGFAYTAFFSADGKRWLEHPGNPLFYDADSMSLFWSPPLHRFVCINKSLQPYRKHLLDHGGPTPSLGDDALRDRRVLMIRSSPDGRRWEPSASMPDVWNRNGRKAAIPDQFLTLPDVEDPPDMEFYCGNGFWYHDRAYMTVLNYAASPLVPRKHAPQLDNEWWTSSDGLHWERPARGVNALEVFPQVPRLETHPLIINGMILFPKGNMLLGLREDRISYVGARANGEFSTRSFQMPTADLYLNAASPAPERPFATNQAYVMVAVLDEKSQTISGFEAEKCLIRGEDRCDILLKWGDTSARQLAGRTVRLRFFLRSANIYAVTARD